MLTLAFDTSSSQGGVALLENDQVLNRMVWDRDISHGELLTPALEKCLLDSKISFKDLDALAIVNGPGSFTGVRIAVNAARSLGFALDKPIFVYDTAETLARAVTPRPMPLVVVLNAHKNLVFVATYENVEGEWKCVKPLDTMTLDGLEKLVQTKMVCIGDGYEEFHSEMSEALLANLVRDQSLSDLPDPAELGRMSWRNRDTHPPIGWKEVTALYIRASGAEEKLREGQ